VTISDAVQSCNRLNMSLIAPEFSTIVEPLMSVIFGKIFKNPLNHPVKKFFPAKYKKALEFWTSGTNEGEFCDVENIFAWCATEKRVAKTEMALRWETTAKAPTSLERFISLKLAASTDF